MQVKIGNRYYKKLVDGSAPDNHYYIVRAVMLGMVHLRPQHSPTGTIKVPVDEFTTQYQTEEPWLSQPAKPVKLDGRDDPKDKDSKKAAKAQKEAESNNRDEQQ